MSRARERLERLLPEGSFRGLKTAAECRAWIDAHAADLRWDEKAGRYAR